MIGREPTLPVDLVFRLDKHDKLKTLSKHVENLQVQLMHAYEACSKYSLKDHSRTTKVFLRSEGERSWFTGRRLSVGKGLSL